MDNNHEFDQLYKVDFGDPTETALRVAGVFIGSLFLFAYAGWLSAIVWSIGFVSMLTIYYVFLTQWQGHASRRLVRIGQISFLIQAVWFLWLPILMVISGDLAISTAGLCVIVCIYYFFMRQFDYEYWLVLARTVIVAGSSGIVVGSVILRVDALLAQIGLCFAWAVMTKYYAQVMLVIRRDKETMKRSVERSAHGQKMEALGQMAGGVAHDFNNILTSAMGHLELAQLSDDEVERNNAILESRRSLGRAAQTIKDLLQFARPNAGSKTVTSANSLIVRIQAFSRPALPSSLELNFKNSSDDLFVMVEEDHFFAAVMNLIVNASQALEGKGKIEVSTASILVEDTNLRDLLGQYIAPNEFVSFNVTDSGPGVPSEIIERIAEPFFTTKETGEGTGLGLSMASAYAQRAGGGLLLKSIPSDTCFSLLLPKVNKTDLIKES